MQINESQAEDNRQYLKRLAVKLRRYSNELKITGADERLEIVNLLNDTIAEINRKLYT